MAFNTAAPLDSIPVFLIEAVTFPNCPYSVLPCAPRLSALYIVLIPRASAFVWAMRNDLQIAEPLKVGFFCLFTCVGKIIFQARDILNGMLSEASQALRSSHLAPTACTKGRMGHAERPTDHTALKVFRFCDRNRFVFKTALLHPS